MNKCKSCQKEIDDKATKCPYCQAHQKWFKNPQIYGLILPLIFIPIIFTSTGLWNRKSYTDYKDSFSTETVSTSVTEKCKIHTYNITNDTAHTWSRLSYQFIGKDESGKVVIVESENEYAWKVMPNSSSMVSVKTPKDTLATQWELKILDMNSDRF